MGGGRQASGILKFTQSALRRNVRFCFRSDSPSATIIMMQAQVPVLSDMAQALCAVLILLVPLTAAGLALIHTGLGRSRSAAHAMLGSVCAGGVAVLAYFFCGWSLQGFAGGS